MSSIRAVNKESYNERVILQFGFFHSSLIYPGWKDAGMSEMAASRTLIIGDIHGELERLDRILEQIPWQDPDARLVFLGDYVDRGKRSREVVDRVLQVREQRPDTICLRGNHELMMLQVLDSPDAAETSAWWFNGGIQTMMSYGAQFSDAVDEFLFNRRSRMLADLVPQEHWNFLRSLAPYYEDGHAFYIHAGLTPVRDTEHGPENGDYHPPAESREEDLLWQRNPSFWRNYQGKLVVFGHTQTSYIERALGLDDEPAEDTVWFGPAVIGVDCGSGKGGRLACLELPSRAVYYSD